MADWGPISKDTENDVKPFADREGGAVTTPESGSKHHAPVSNQENYDSTDGRHSQTDHQGWKSLESNSGTGVGEDGKPSGSFADGPGPWRQT